MSSYYQQRGCWLYWKLSTSIIGVLLGFSAFLSFMVIFQNYHCSGWAFLSGVLSLVTFIMHVCVYRDITCSMRTITFQKLKVVGLLGFLVGLAVFVGYLVKGILVHEKGVVVTGWFIVTVWGWMTCKWGFLLFWYARKYQRALMDEVNDILSVNS